MNAEAEDAEEMSDDERRQHVRLARGLEEDE